MKRKRRRIVWLSGFFGLVCLFLLPVSRNGPGAGTIAYAGEAEIQTNETANGQEQTEWAYSADDYDFRAIQDFLDGLSEAPMPSFSSLVKSLAAGDAQPALEAAGEILRGLFGSQIENGKAVLIRVMILAVSAALFSSIASVFCDTQISQSAWFVMYLLLSGTLLSGFGSCCSLNIACLERLFLFVRLLVPAFSLALTGICGAAGVSVWYEVTFLMIAAVDWLFLSVLIPGIRIYVCLYLLNELTGEDYLSGLLELMQMLFDWMMKTVGGVVIGMQVIQGLILPAAGQLKGQFISRLIQAVPGIGSGVRSASELLFGTGILIKNGIGAAGCLVIVLICLAPVLQTGVVTIMYYAVGAAVQPVCDDRIKNCIAGTAYGIRMLLKASAMAAFLFAVSIALICAFTGRIF